jgi:hypothetical protein
VVGAVCAVVIAVFAASAFACTNLASINLSSTFGKPGDAIVVTGSGFSGGVEGPMEGMDMGAMDMANMGSTASLGVRPPVVLRWNGPTGHVLTSAIPDRTGSISVTINIPETQPGQYSLVAVQKNAQGYDVYGTPARATVFVTADGKAPLEAAGGTVGGGGGLDSATTIGLTVAIGALGLGLFAAGGVSVVRQLGGKRVPAAARTDDGG